MKNTAKNHIGVDTLRKQKQAQEAPKSEKRQRDQAEFDKAVHAHLAEMRSAGAK